MHYLGGKARIGPKIVTFLESIRENRPFYEPFCGGLWITHRMTGERHASDVVQPLITLYQAMQEGWLPPEVVTEEQYAQHKSLKDPSDPMTAFVGYGCSFGGKFFGGYARGERSRNYAKNARNSLVKKISKCQDVIFSCSDYQSLEPSGSLVYCDPPYLNTTKYNAAKSFNSEGFWDWCRKIRKNNILVVSEYQAPEDFKCVLEIPTQTDLHQANTARVERLFM